LLASLAIFIVTINIYKYLLLFCILHLTKSHKGEGMGP